ncbi:MAG: hypothetical protein J5666_06805 [Bacilli bacterium]|nr:hypothetical protein [Bacilli bacterium]
MDEECKRRLTKNQIYNKELKWEVLINHNFIKRGSDNSVGINIGNTKSQNALENAANAICEKFKLSNGNLFKKKLEQSTSGDGKELEKINALHSSSLLALLFFYRIDKLKIDDVIYHESFFEVKNMVFENEKGWPTDKPSNMDVVLLGEKENSNEPVILFLECKFSEYLTNSVEHGISGKYFKEGSLSKKLYDIVQSKGFGHYATVDNGKSYCFYTDKAYSHGTKQVISHLVGIKNFVEKRSCYYQTYHKDDRAKVFAYADEPKIKFRELLFEFKDCNKQSRFKDYRELSEKIADAFRESGLLNFVEYQNPLTYKELIEIENNKEQVDTLVRKFYKFDE